MTADAFDIADRLQTPVIMLTDLDLGMNQHITDDLEWDDSRQYDLGKVVTAQELDEMDRFGRYLDVDGDGITYRSLAGVHKDKGAFFTRGTSRTEYAVYTESSDEYEKNMQRLLVKWRTASQYIPAPKFNIADDKCDVGLIHFGTSMAASEEAIELISETYGVSVNSMRIRAFPFQNEVDQFIARHQRVFVVEQNRDAQLKTMLVTELGLDSAQLSSILHFNGEPISARFIVKQLETALDLKHGISVSEQAS
jgi:2-oxoglutarate ferredoxin oxidoreductase subunit alpha